MSIRAICWSAERFEIQTRTHPLPVRTPFRLCPLRFFPFRPARRSLAGLPLVDFLLELVAFLQDVREFVGGSSLDDDTTLLAIKAL